MPVQNETVALKNQTPNGEVLVATFAPQKGMNFLSYQKGSVEVIDQSTRPLFETRCAGLGALIGPHFHHRPDNVIPPIRDPSLFPHLAHQTSKEPFSHGVGRYAPWEVISTTEQSIEALLSGDHLWNGVSLKELEGQNFKMRYKAHLLPEGLEIHLSVVGETETVVGLHTYYSLSNGEGTVKTRVQNHYVDHSATNPIPSTWNYSDTQWLTYPLDQETDFGFHPHPDPLNGEILLECASHSLQVRYGCVNEENSFQIWHPKGASFVCIEPLSAKDPRKPKLTTSQLKILISIL